MFNTVTVRSKANPDHNGTWAKLDIEDEMKSLGIKIDKNVNWIEFLFDHVFSDDFDPALYSSIDTFIHNDRLVEIAIKLDNGDDLKITKK